MNQTAYERGAGRLAAGFLLLLVSAGSAERTPIGGAFLLMLTGSLLLGLWGLSRMKHGPHVPIVARWWARVPYNPRVLQARLRFPAYRRHALSVLARRTLQWAWSEQCA